MVKKRLLVIGMAALAVFAMVALFGCAFEPEDAALGGPAARTALPGVPEELEGTWRFLRVYQDEENYTDLTFQDGVFENGTYTGNVLIAGNDVDSGPDPTSGTTDYRERPGTYTFDPSTGIGNVYGVNGGYALGQFELIAADTMYFDSYYIYGHPAYFYIMSGGSN
jgi:hypothetical protein